MNSLPTVPAARPWSWPRWTFFLVASYAAHLGFLFAFGSRKPIVPRAVVNAPVLQLTTRRSEREQLDDPTLFALPQPSGFAGEAWLRRPPINFAPFRWTEPPRLLPPSGEKWGASFLQLMATNSFARLELETLPAPQLTRLTAEEFEPIIAKSSRCRVLGELTQRPWLNAPATLPSQPAADWLTNSLVQVWVQADGQVLSPALLQPGSGSKDADQLALKLARTARFAPLPGRAAPLTFGTLIFEWHSVPPTTAIPPTP